MTASTRSYRGVPADERRARRRHALTEAVLDLLLAGGLPAVTVRAVCATARLTPRYFYESHADLDALLRAAVGSVADEMADAALAAVAAAPDDPAARVRGAIAAGYGVLADDPRKANALQVASAGHGALRTYRQEVVARFAGIVVGSVLPGLPGEAGAAHRAREARATALFLMGGSADVIAAVLAGRVRMSRSALVDHLTALWLGALGLPVTGGDPTRI